jgi:DNA-binding GntR family transcriptional regulator
MKRDSIAEVLRREILNATFPPGTALRQQDIAEQLGVSPTPVREAFRMLEADGYVESHAHRGTVVAQRDYRDVIDAYEIRFALESLAARRAVARKDELALDQMKAVTKDAARAMRGGDADGFRRASVGFHHALVDATGSTLLRHMVDRLEAYWFLFPQDRQRMTKAHSEHAAVLQSLTKGDSEAAIRVLRRHLDEQIAVLTDISRKAAATTLTAVSSGAARVTRSRVAGAAAPDARAGRTARRPRSPAAR